MQAIDGQLAVFAFKQSALFFNKKGAAAIFAHRFLAQAGAFKGNGRDNGMTAAAHMVSVKHSYRSAAAFIFNAFIPG